MNRIVCPKSNVMHRTNVEDGVVIVTMFSSFFSIFGGVFLLATHFAFEELVKNRVRKLLRYLTIADLLQAMGYFSAGIRYAVLRRYNPGYEDKNDDLCVAQSFVTTFASMSSFIWTTIIAGHLFRLVILRKSAGISIAYHASAWLLPGKTYSIIRQLLYQVICPGLLLIWMFILRAAYATFQ